MVNASFNLASIVGIVLLIFGFAPFFWKSEGKLVLTFEPMSWVAWICGLILFFQGWRLDPILQFGQFLLVSLTIFICYENIQLRNRLFKLKNQNNINHSKKNDSISKEKRYYRNIGLYKQDDLEFMEDNQVYEIVKLQLLGISNGEIKPEAGEVEYLKNILNDLKKTK